MNNRTSMIIGFFNHHFQAGEATGALLERGFSPTDVHLAIGDEPEGEIADGSELLGADVLEDGGYAMGAGAALGSLAGALVGLATLAIPGGIVAGPVLLAAYGAGAGAAVGGTLGVLTALGVPEDQAEYLKGHKALVGVFVTKARAREAVEVLKQAGADPIIEHINPPKGARKAGARQPHTAPTQGSPSRQRLGGAVGNPSSSLAWGF